MKRVLLLFIILVFNSVFSQEKVRLGIHLGVNHYSLRGTEVLDNVDSNFGYAIGLNFEYKILNKFFLSTDLIFENKQVDYNYEFDYWYLNPDGSNQEFVHYNAVTKSYFNFLTLPITLKYKIGNKNPYFIKSGIYLAKMLSQKEKTEFSPALPDYYNMSSENFPLATEIDNQDYGLTFAIGKEFKIKDKNYLIVELRDNLGFHNSVSRLTAYGYSNQEIKTNTITLLIQWSFGL